MVDIVNVGLKVDSSDVKNGTKELDRFGKQAGKTQTATGKLTGSFKKLLGPLLAMASATAALRKLIDTARKFDVINASLVTVTGSTEAASKAFEGLQAFASTTPFALQEVTNAFIKMKALGLDPSSRSLTSFGNTASAMGKSLNQMVEAVADASTFEFERLKEFGIKARQQANSVSFTFRGVTTTVGKSSKEIQDYLLAIGENDFAGAMERRADSLDGALSNLGDTWDALFLTITKQGPGDAIAETIRDAIDVLEDLDVLIASGAITHGINAIGTQFFETGKDIESALNEITKIIKEASDYWGIDGSSSAGFIADAFTNLPANIRAAIKLATIEIAAFVDKTMAYGATVFDALNPMNWFDGKDIGKELESKIKTIDSARKISIESILKERDAIVKRSEAEVEAAKVSFDAEQARRAARSATIESTGEAEAAAAAAARSAEEDARLEQELNRAIHDEEELERIYEHNERKLEAQMEYYDRLYDLETGSQQAALDFVNSVRMMDLQGAVKHGSAMLSNLAKQSKIMFGIHKAFSLAQAVVSLPSAVIQSFENGGGYPWGLVPAGLMLTEGLSQIKKISSASFGGGASAGGSIGGGGGVASMPAPSQSATVETMPVNEPVKHDVSIVVSGGLHSDEDVRNLVSRINEIQEDMGQVSLVTS